MRLCLQKKKPHQHLMLDFRKYPDLLAAIREVAEANFRTPEAQILWMIKNAESNHRSPDERLNAVLDVGILKAARKQSPRSYLGASTIGKPCSRAIQFDYYKTEPDADKGFSANTYRISPSVIPWRPWPSSGSVSRDSIFEQRKRMALDSDSRLPAAASPDTLTAYFAEVPPMTITFPALWECKTAQHKKFKEASEKGIAKSHPQYLAEISVYQAYLELTDNPAILTMIDKDTQKLYHEAIPFNRELAQKTSDKAATILSACDAGELLPRIANSQHFTSANSRLHSTLLEFAGMILSSTQLPARTTRRATKLAWIGCAVIIIPRR